MSLHPALSHATSPYFGDPKTRKNVQRWAALAEQRFAYLTELFDSGRWRHFHTETEFLDNIQEAKETLERWQAMANGVFVAPVIRDAPPIQPLIAAIQVAQAEMATVEMAKTDIVKPAVQHRAEVLSFEDHAAQRDAARRPQLVAMSDVIVDHSAASDVMDIPDVEAPVHHVSPLDLFDHDAIVARYPMLRAAAM